MPACEAMYYLYILSNRHRTLYVGITNDLERRLIEHRRRETPGFPQRYGIDRLVYFEYSEAVEGVIQREKEIKGWVRRKKVALIESANPAWRDLSEGW